MLVAVAATACALPTNPERLARRADAIQGGAVESGSSFAVAVIEGADGTCSGTLIAPNLVLTARHCVADDDGGAFVDCATERFLAARPASGFRVSTDAVADFDTAAYQVTKILVPSDSSFCGNDLALVLLDSVIPAAVAAPAAPLLEPTLAKLGTTISAIGHGTTGPGKSDDGTRRRRDNVAIQCIPGDAALGCDPRDYAMTAAELAAGDGLCDGDSGSGAFVTASLAAGSPIVAGVLSRAADDGVKCTDAIYGRTDSKAAFLVSGATEAAKAGGYALPAWAGGSATPDVDAGVDAAAVGDDAAATTPEPVAPSSRTTTTGCALSAPRVATKERRAGDPRVLLSVIVLGALVARRRVRGAR